MGDSNLTYCVEIDRCLSISTGLWGVFNYEHYSTVHDDNTYAIDDASEAYTFLLNTYSDPRCLWSSQGLSQISELSSSCDQGVCCLLTLVADAQALVVYAKFKPEMSVTCPANTTFYIPFISPSGPKFQDGLGIFW